MGFCTTAPERKFAKSWLYPQDNGYNCNKYFVNEAGKRSKEIRFDASFFKKLPSLDPLNGFHGFRVKMATSKFCSLHLTPPPPNLRSGLKKDSSTEISRAERVYFQHEHPSGVYFKIQTSRCITIH